MIQFNAIYQQDCLERLKLMDDNCIDCAITSPPYWCLRDYGVDGQIGLEETPDKYVNKLVKVFREVKRVLKQEGTCWLNLGDTYNIVSGGMEQLKRKGKDTPQYGSIPYNKGYIGVSQEEKKKSGLKHKDLVGIPWRVALALQADGWYLRQDIIWSKPNPMPESVTDRCTKSHEYVFLLTKSPKYYFDNNTIKEKANEAYASRYNSEFNVGKKELSGQGRPNNASNTAGMKKFTGFRNKRSVWTIQTKSFKEAHFATFPEELIIPMIQAGCPEKGIVLDIFFGSGTTGLVALKLNRNFIGIEINPEYVKIANRRIKPFLNQQKLTEVSAIPPEDKSSGILAPIL